MGFIMNKKNDRREAILSVSSFLHMFRRLIFMHRNNYYCIFAKWVHSHAMIHDSVKISAITRSIYRGVCLPLSPIAIPPVGNPSCIERACTRNPESLFVRFCDRTSERARLEFENADLSVVLRRGSATSAFQRVKKRTSAPSG